MFRKFENEQEEQLATEIIASIDKGEEWIFKGAEGSSDFGGFIDRLFYCKDNTYGTYSASIFNGKLRLQIGFNNDLPNCLSEELLNLINKARSQVNTFTSVWYPPNNKELDEWIFKKLPWKARGHKTYELTFKREDSYLKVDFPKNISIIPFSKEYLDMVCSMLDESLAHTFDNPNSAIFLTNKENYLAEWVEKSKTNDCCIMLENGELAGIYIMKGSELDIIAIKKDKQSRGLGRVLLHHAKEQIFNTKKDEPFLYCIDRNIRALQFYKREGMIITGHSGYAYFEEI